VGDQPQQVRRRVDSDPTDHRVGRPRAVELRPRPPAAGCPREEQANAMNRVIPILAVSDMQRSLDFYSNVLGFTVEFTMPGENGTLNHASVARGDAHIMFSPLAAWGDTVEHRDHLGKGVSLYVSLDKDDDVDAIYFGAKAAGANIIQEPVDQFWGDRDWGLTDPDGYTVFISKPVRTVTPEEMLAHANQLAGAPAD
jgi:uncharacterized glyoxalase superfamily protein PhnB